MAGVVRVTASSGRCWICGLTATAGEKLPGRRHRVRLLCKTHDQLVFGGSPQSAQDQAEHSGDQG